MQPWASTSSARISYRNAPLIFLALAHVNGADIESSNFRNQHVPNRNSYEYLYRKDSTSSTSERISSSDETSKNLRKASVQLVELESPKELKPLQQFSNNEYPYSDDTSYYTHQYYAPNDDDRGDVEWWPWHHDDDNDDGKDDKNKTDDDNTNPSDNTDDNSNNSDSDDASPATDNSCASHIDCTTCYASSSTCHWCAFDNQCHAKASWYGCTLGANCNADNNDNDDNTHNSTSSDDDTTPSDGGGGGGNKKKDNSCSSHSTCSECSLSSHVCHWCEKDNACHAIGSWYGCAHGANCYSNHRCRRIEPEVMEPWSWWKMASQMGVAPLALAGILGFMVICCSSVLFTGVKALKGAYEDLDFVERSSAHVAPMSLDAEEMEGNRHSPLSSMDRSEAKDTSDSKHFEIHESQPLLNEQIDENLEFVDEESDSQLHSPNSSSTLGSGSMLSRQSVTPHPSISRLPTSNSHRSSSHMACFMTTCRIWYFLIILSVFLFSSGYIYFFPKTPLYNVCSDEIAWRSIIDGMTSLKMKVSSMPQFG